MRNENELWKITYKQLGVILISFVIGLVTALLISNSQQDSVTSFTTTELIGFVLTVVVSGASIVLAISAIALGKTSEQAVIKRSDESIKLQTDIFTKTTDALQSIKASTGVTEKRIEDIISGRAGEISRQLAEIASDETVTGKIDMKELEEKIKKSITGTLEREETEEDKKRRMARRQELQAKRKQYHKAHDKLLYSIANKDGVGIVKFGHGTPSFDVTEEYGRFDGVFKQNKHTLAVNTFMPTEPDRYMRSSLGEIFVNLAAGVKSDNIDKLHLVLFEEDENSPMAVSANQALSTLNESFVNKTQIHAISYAQADSFSERLS